MEQHALNLARAFHRRGDAVRIGYVEAPVALDQLDVAGIDVVRIASGNPLLRYGAIGRIARMARSADLVHCTGWDASAWGRLAGILARRPVVVTEHSSGDRTTQRTLGIPNRRLIALHNRLLDRGTAATVAVANEQLAPLQREGVAADKLHLIPNGVSLERLRAAAADALADRAGWRARLGLPADALVVTQVARFIPQKRQQWTYEAVRELRAQLGDVHVLFAGDGPTRAALTRTAARDGADWAHFLGHRDDVPALLAASDLAVLPSAAEAMPMAVIEALALGIPQVATEVGDAGLLLRQAGAGIAVGAADQAGFVAACRTLLSDPVRAAAVREAATAAAGEFAVERMVARYDELFDAVIANAARAGATR